MAGKAFVLLGLNHPERGNKSREFYSGFGMVKS